MVVSIAAAAGGLAVIGTVAFVYRRAVLKARKIKAEIAAAKASGKSVLYFKASELVLNGKDVSGFPQVKANKDRGVLVEPGRYDAVGTFSIRDDAGKPLATFTDAELSFSLKSGKDYELGVYLFYPEILSSEVSRRQPGPSVSGQGILALACVVC